jgi:biotin synthase-like enzyme
MAGITLNRWEYWRAIPRLCLDIALNITTRSQSSEIYLSCLIFINRSCRNKCMSCSVTYSDILYRAKS